VAEIVKNKSVCHKPVISDKAHSENESNDHPALRTTYRFPVLIIVLFSFLVYFSALSGDFVYDDMGQILKNPWIRDIKNIATIFSESVWGYRPAISISNYYRPLMHIIYMLNYYLFGLKPWGFHLVNILFHCGVSVLVFLIIRSFLTENRAPVPPVYLSSPFIAAMLFAAHPIHTEAVTWIAGLPDVAFTFFYLLSFYLYIRSRGRVSRGYLFSVVCFTLAAFFKEPALTLPIILLAYDYLFGEVRTRPVYYVRRYIPYAIIGSVYLVLRMRALGGFAPQTRYAMLSTYQYVINVFPLFMHYLEKLLLPLDLNAFYVFRPIASLLEPKGILSFIGTIVFLVLLYIALKKNEVVFLGLLFVTVPLLPVLYIPALGENTFTERYLYLPSVGYLILLAVFLSWAMEKLPRAGRGITIVSIAIVGLYTAGTIDRSAVWKDNFSLWSDTAQKSPESAIAHDGLAFAYASKGQLDMAIAEFQIALRLNPDYAEAHKNLGVAYASKGQLDMAIAEFQIALRLNPDSAEAHYNLGRAYASKGQLDMAIAEFQIALHLNPDYAEAHNNLGVAYASKGQLDMAIVEYQTALRSEPDYALAHYNLALVRLKKGDMDMARREIELALSIRPDLYEARQLLNSIISR
jgi:tetratricopeptide (TPR) repeat protein